MNCHEIASMLDERGVAILHLDPADEDRRAVEVHTTQCRDCAAALAAIVALKADPLPDMHGDILAAVFSGGPDPAHAAMPLRKPRAAMIIGALGLGGAVFAAVGWLTLGGPGNDEGPAGAGPASVATAPLTGGDALAADAIAASTAGRLIERIRATEEAEREAFSATLLGGLADGEFFALLKVPPIYPPQAGSRGLEGEVVVEFTITDSGDIADAVAISSTDPVFEQSAIDAVRQFKYRPRVVDGQRQTVPGVRNLIRYKLEQAPVTDPDGQLMAGGQESEDQEPAPEAETMDGLRFAALLEPAYACLEQNDLRCIELELDVIRATHRLEGWQDALISHIYGFIYHRRGRYELAIEAYRRAAGPAEGSASWLRPHQLRTVALIHYERDRYQEAMDAMLEYLKTAPGPSAADYLFIDRLEELGAQSRP